MRWFKRWISRYQARCYRPSAGGLSILSCMPMLSAHDCYWPCACCGGMSVTIVAPTTRQYTPMSEVSGQRAIFRGKAAQTSRKHSRQIRDPAKLVRWRIIHIPSVFPAALLSSRVLLVLGAHTCPNGRVTPICSWRHQKHSSPQTNMPGGLSLLINHVGIRRKKWRVVMDRS